MSRKKVERNISYDDVRQRYYVNFDFGLDPETGKQVKKTQTYEKLTQARAALRKHEAARDAGQVVIPKELTVGRWLETWMTNVVKLSRETTTVYAYEKMIKNHITPALGDVPIQKLTPMQLQAYYAEKVKGGEISSNTVRKHHDLLNSALRMAVKQGIILSNPASKVEPPTVKRPDIHYYSLEELRKLLELSEGTRLEVLIKLAGLLGLRREEIMGLTWDCVDFENHRIEIREVRTTAGKEVVTKDPKTFTSRRAIRLKHCDLSIIPKKNTQNQAP